MRNGATRSSSKEWGKGERYFYEKRQNLNRRNKTEDNNKNLTRTPTKAVAEHDGFSLIILVHSQLIRILSARSGCTDALLWRTHLRTSQQMHPRYTQDRDCYQLMCVCVFCCLCTSSFPCCAMFIIVSLWKLVTLNGARPHLYSHFVQRQIRDK